MRIGTVRELWRYPVKSMAGQRLAATEVGPLGVPGDRGWAVRDEVAGEVRGAKKLAGLLQCAAAYRREPGGSAMPPVDVTLPDGRTVGSDDPDAAAVLSGFLDRPVTLWPRRPADDLDFYRRGAPDDPDLEREIRAIFGLLPDEPMVDLAAFPPEVLEFTSPPGTYFDVTPLHLLTTASLATLASHLPDSVIDVRRFRPNVLIETETDLGGFPEAEWAGRDVRIGGAVAHVEAPAIRCVMPTHAQADLPADRRIMRALVREAKQHLGVYATVAAVGPVREGDPVELLDTA